jgi:hypothetical protein
MVVTLSERKEAAPSLYEHSSIVDRNVDEYTSALTLSDGGLHAINTMSTFKRNLRFMRMMIETGAGDPGGRWRATGAFLRAKTSPSGSTHCAPCTWDYGAVSRTQHK